MIPSIFIFVYLAAHLIAIIVGAAVLSGLLAGELLDKSTRFFLKCVLLASVIGLFCPSQHFLRTSAISMLCVYVCGAAVLAWLRFHMAGIWSSVFALSTTALLYASVYIVIAQVFRYLSVFQSQPLAEYDPQFFLTEVVVAVSFVVLGALAVRRFRSSRPHRSLRHSLIQ